MMYTFLTRHTSCPTGIADVMNAAGKDTKGVYSLNGTYLSNTADTLPRGVYIAQGRKIIK